MQRRRAGRQNLYNSALRDSLIPFLYRTHFFVILSSLKEGEDSFYEKEYIYKRQPDVLYHSESGIDFYSWENNCKTQLQKHVMCKWRTKGINSFTGTYIERQGKRGIDSPAHGADSKEEKSKYNKCCIDDPHKCTYIPLRK